VGGGHAPGRIAKPDEIAGAAVCLASDASSFLTGTGTGTVIDGGYRLW
jgi:NAD(P)-dependent dehydrogenase (short-subunit alcohol dehydrogenase family)